MLRLLLQRIQNLLSNQSQKINLITDEFKNYESSIEEEKSIENALLILSVSLISILGLVTYLNIQKSNELIVKNLELKSKVQKTASIDLSLDEIKSRNQNLQKIKDIKNQIQINSVFFDFLGQVAIFLKNDSLVSINYKKNNNLVNFELIINTNNKSFELFFSNFFKSNFPNLKIQKNSEVEIPYSETKQFKYTGIYELGKK